MKKSISIGLLWVSMISCDAVNQLQYSVKNKTDEKIRIHHPQYPVNRNQGEFSATVDTIIEIYPNQTAWMGTSPTDIDFPWATKNIYDVTPGICGLALIETDTVITLDCTNSSWKYKKRWSTLKIK